MIQIRQSVASSARSTRLAVAVGCICLAPRVAAACGDCQLTQAIWTDLSRVVGPVLLAAVVVASVLDYRLLRVQYKGAWDKWAYGLASNVLAFLVIIPALNCVFVGYDGHPVRSAAIGVAGLLGLRVAGLTWLRLSGRTPVRKVIVASLAVAPAAVCVGVLCVISLVQHGALPLPWSHLR